MASAKAANVYRAYGARDILNYAKSAEARRKYIGTQIEALNTKLKDKEWSAEAKAIIVFGAKHRILGMVYQDVPGAERRTEEDKFKEVKYWLGDVVIPESIGSHHTWFLEYFDPPPI